MTRKLCLAIATALVLSWPLSAVVPTVKPEEVGFSSERLRRVTDLLQRHVAAAGTSGAVTLVARHGRIAHFEALGVQDLDSRKPMQKDTIFRIMSMTKPIVSVSMLMMMEEGKVRLTDPVSRFVPELKELKVAVAQAGGGTDAPFDVVPAAREITVRDLLTHTSGLVSGPISTREARKVALAGRETLADYIPRLARVPLEFQPGTRWAYSPQAGFDVLARIVEITSGQPFDRFTRERIFEPLAMKDTFFYPADGNPRIVTRYDASPTGLQKAVNPGFMNGAYFSGGGGLMSTAGDYLQFAQMLLNGGELDGKRLLSPASIERMSAVVAPDTLPGRPRGESYGLGVRVVSDPVEFNSFLSKGTYGWSGAYGTHFFIDPIEKIVAVLMTQTPSQPFRRDWESAVMHAFVGGGAVRGTN